MNLHRPFELSVRSATVADYPDDWTNPDLDAAVAALTSDGVEVTGNGVGKGVRASTSCSTGVPAA